MHAFLRAVGLLAALTLADPRAVSGQAETKDPDALFAKGVSLHQAGDVDGAIRDYEAALELQPDRVDARSNLGAALARQGRYEEAVSHYRRALAIEPGQTDVRFNLGLALHRADRIEEAAPEFEVVLKAVPKHAGAALLLADCRLRMGQSGAVIDLLSPLETELGDDHLFAYLLGTALIDEGEVERGQRFIDVLFRDGDSAEAHLLMGAQHLRRNDSLKALPELERAVELNPDLPTVHALYGHALRLSRDFEGAAREYLAELGRNPNDFASNLWLGLLRRDENRLDEAMVYLERAARMRPRDPSVAYALGRVHLGADRLAEARKAFELLVETAPTYRQGHVLLATVYYRLNERELGDQQRAIVERLRAEAKAGQGIPGADIGPTSFRDSAGPTEPRPRGESDE